jgi:hypothetical protein
LRHANFTLLQRLPAEIWERTGLHSENGVMTLYDVFLRQLNHIQGHIQQIEAVKSSL